MKKILLLFTGIACMVLTYSCHKDSKVVPTDYYFTAIKNYASDWGAVGSTSTLPGDSLRLTGFRPSSGERINVDIKFNGDGTYPLALNQAELFAAVDSDALTSHYHLDTIQKNTLIISSYNTKTRIISGSFELHLLRDSAIENTQLNFTSGLFRVKLPD